MAACVFRMDSRLPLNSNHTPGFSKAGANPTFWNSLNTTAWSRKWRSTCRLESSPGTDRFDLNGLARLMLAAGHQVKALAAFSLSSSASAFSASSLVIP
jgi:hypothetical protein